MTQDQIQLEINARTSQVYDLNAQEKQIEQRRAVIEDEIRQLLIRRNVMQEIEAEKEADLQKEREAIHEGNGQA